MNLEEIVQEKLDADTEFTTSLEGKSDEDKTKAIADRKAELREQEFSAVASEAEKNKTIASDQKTRAEKAEALAKEKKPGTEQAPKEDVLSEKDRLAFTRSDAHIDDFDQIVQAAKVLGVTVTDALNNDLVKGIIAKNAEHRKTANAANTRPARTGPKEASDDDVLKDAFSNDKLPEKGSKEAEKLFNARHRKN